MKILVCITELDKGGAEQACVQVIKRLATRHSIEIVQLYGSNDFEHILTSSNIRMHNLNVAGVFSILAVRKTFQAIYNALQPEIVHSWLFHANFLSRLATPKGTPLINSYRVHEPRASHIFPDKLTKRLANHACCVSKDVMKFAIDTVGWTHEKCSVIENGVDVSRFTPNQAPPVALSINGLSIGRIDHQKGFDILISALGSLQDTSWTWTIAGVASDQGYLNKLKHKARSLGIADRITWASPTYGDNLVQLYQQSNLFVCPSRWEGQANVVLEALACGLPVLASDKVGYDHDTPISTVKPNTSSAWASILKKALTNNFPHPALQVRLDYVRHRSWDQVAKQHEELYESLIQA